MRSTYSLMAEEGLEQGVAYPADIIFALICIGIFFVRCLHKLVTEKMTENDKL